MKEKQKEKWKDIRLVKEDDYGRLDWEKETSPEVEDHTRFVSTFTDTQYGERLYEAVKIKHGIRDIDNNRSKWVGPVNGFRFPSN